MKPPGFDYRAPITLDDALAVLQDDPDAKVLAGDRNLIPRNPNFMDYRVPDIKGGSEGGAVGGARAPRIQEAGLDGGRVMRS